MEIWKAPIIFCLVFPVSTVARGNEVIAVDFLNKLLESRSQITYIKNELTGSGNGGFEVRSIPYQGAARVVNSYISEVSTIQFDKAKIKSLPEYSLYTQKQLINCADTSITSMVSLSVSGTKMWSVTKTNGITTTSAASISGQIGVQGVQLKGMNLSWQQAINTSTQTQEQFTQNTIRAMNDTISIGPRKTANVSLMAYQISIEIPFSATIIVDGDLAANQNGLTSSASLLSKEERTLPFSGTLKISDVTEASIRTDELQGAAGCEGNAGRLVAGELTPQATFATGGASKSLKEGFIPLNEFGRVAGGLKPKPLNVQAAAAIAGAEIGNPDGISYKILFTIETAKPDIQCGFNDIGMPNIGIYDVETRHYTNYANGQLINQWTDTVEVFKRCNPV